MYVHGLVFVAPAAVGPEPVAVATIAGHADAAPPVAAGGTRHELEVVAAAGSDDDVARRRRQPRAAWVEVHAAELGAVVDEAVAVQEVAARAAPRAKLGRRRPREEAEDAVREHGMLPDDMWRGGAACVEGEVAVLAGVPVAGGELLAAAAQGRPVDVVVGHGETQRVIRLRQVTGDLRRQGRRQVRSRNRANIILCKIILHYVFMGAF